MNKKRYTVVRIETHDTLKLYEFPGSKDIPQLWEVSLGIKCVDQKTGHVANSSYRSPFAVVYLERSTLEEAGLLPQTMTTPVTIEPTETPEGLLMKLLGSLGFYPEGG